ncbi:MAG: 50S ribosomal protein L19 [Candidatus Gracilibacteria bacterium]
MSQAILSHVSDSSIKKAVPELKSGMTVRVHQKIVEGEKERVQIFEGLIIRVNAGSNRVDKTFTVRKIVEGVGVEKIFPIYSSLIEKIEITKRGKVRRAKLYYMRDLQGKSTRLQEGGRSSKVQAEEPELVAEEPIVEEQAVEETPAEEVPTEEAPAEEQK